MCLRLKGSDSMAYTISLHTEGDRMVRGHNRRDAVTLKEDHIDHDGIHEIWIDQDIKQFYRDKFSDAVEQFNARNRKTGHAERNVDNYLSDVKNDDKKHVVYETIIQIGSQEQCPTEAVCKEIFKEYLEEFIENNPTMHVIGAYYHADEETPHLHLDYVPVATELSRGMHTQNSHNKAIEQLGIEKGKYKNLAHAFQERERNRLEQVCKEHGLDIQRGVCADKRRHMEQDLYKLQQGLERTLEHVKELEVIDKIQDLNLTDIRTIVEKQEELEQWQQDLKQQEQKVQKDRQTIERNYQAKKREIEQLEKETIEEHGRRLLNEEKAKRLDKILEICPDVEIQLGLRHSVGDDIDYSLEK